MEFLNRLYIMACFHLQEFFHDEEGAVDIVAVVVLIAIAVALAVLFREQIGKLVTTLLQKITDNASNMGDPIG